MLKRLLLAALLAASPAFAAVDTPDAVTESFNTDDPGTTITFSHTVTSGTTALLVGMCTTANEETASVTWNGNAMTRIADVDDSTNSGSAGLEVWGLDSPTPATGNVVFNGDDSNYNSPHVAGAVNLTGTTTGGIGTTITLLTSDLNNGDVAGVTNQAVHASGGDAGNALFLIGCAIGDDMDGGSNNAGFTAIQDRGSGGGAGNAGDVAQLIAELLDSAPSAITHTWGATDDNVSGLFEVEVAASNPTFTSNPALNNCTDTGCTYDYTADASGDTLYWMITDVASSAPTCDQIEAGTGSHGNGSEATTGSADSVTATSTDSPEHPEYDFHFCIEDSGGNDSSVVTDADQPLSAPTGSQFKQLTSVGTDSPCDRFNTAVDPDMASTDWLLAPADVSPGGLSPDDTLTIGADCHFSYNSDGSRQSAENIAVFDRSVGDYHASDIDFWDNDVAIACDDETEILIFDEDSLPASVDLDDDCTDEAQPTYTVTSGTLHTGLTLTGATGVISFTYSTEDEAGDIIEFTATGEAGDTDLLNKEIYVVDTWTMPDLSDLTLSVAEDTVLASAPWYQDLSISASTTCHESVAADTIISQSPTASAEVDDPLAAVTVTVSTGICVNGRRTKGVTLPGVSIGN